MGGEGFVPVSVSQKPTLQQQLRSVVQETQSQTSDCWQSKDLTWGLSHFWYLAFECLINEDV